MNNDPSQPGEPHAPSGTTAASAGLHGTAVVQRGLNDTRLAILGIMLSIALEVAFGVQNVAWWWRVALGLLVFAGIASSAHLVLSRERPTHIVMELAHWVLGRKH